MFNNFTNLINTVHESINFYWITNLNTIIDHLAFDFARQHMWATFKNKIEASIFITREIYGNVVASVNQQCEEVAIQLILELQGRFLAQDFMDALGIVYPQH